MPGIQGVVGNVVWSHIFWHHLLKPHHAIWFLSGPAIYLLSNTRLASTMHVKWMYINDIIERHFKIQQTRNIFETSRFKIKDSSERLLLQNWDPNNAIAFCHSKPRSPWGSWEHVENWRAGTRKMNENDLQKEQTALFRGGFILVFGPILSVWYINT